MLERKINFKESGSFMKNGFRRCVPLGTLFALKTMAVISPNTGKEAIIIEDQHALCIHTHVHKSTYTHSLRLNNRCGRPH